MSKKRKTKVLPAAESSEAKTPPKRQSLRQQLLPPEEVATPPKPVNHLQKVLCEICTDNKNHKEMFEVMNCSHSYCTDCVTKHIAAKIEEHAVGSTINCPGLDCNGTLEFEACGAIIPKLVIDRWDDKLTESLIGMSERFYCPFKDCSAMLVNDGCGDSCGGEVIRESECPICRRLFCAQCRVPWHPEIGCEELQRLNEDEKGKEDLMVRKLAKEMKWMRCPHCRFYVEKTHGCLHIVCRCGHEFCYACGEVWSSTHEGLCPRRHIF